MKRPLRRQSISNLLSRSLQYQHSLIAAVQNCATNFRWLAAHGRQPIPVLDFDVICGALPRLALRGHVERFQEGATEVDWHWIGPNSLNGLLRSMRDFILPPGTIAELLEKKKEISGTLSTHAQSFLTTIERARTLNDPSAVLASQEHFDLRDALLEELGQFTFWIDQIDLLDTLVTRAYSSANLSFNPSAATVRAFREALERLRGLRPTRSINNFHDALNTTVVIELFNRRWKKGSGKLPILISETKIIHDLEDFAISYLNVDRADSPQLFHNYLYLVFQQSILSKTEGRYGPALDYTRVLLSDLTEIAEVSARLVRTVRQRLDAAMLEEKLNVWNVGSDDWEFMLFLRRQFERNWGYLIAPAIRTAEYDRMEYLRFLLSRDAATIGGLKVDEELLSRIRLHLQETHAHYDLSRLLLQYQKTSDPDSVQQTQLFSYSVVDNDGRLLTDSNLGIDLNYCDPAIFLGDHDVRVIVHQTYASSGGFLAIGSLCDSKRSGQRSLTITWLHSSPSEVCSKAAAILTTLWPGSTVRVYFYDRNQVKSREIVPRHAVKFIRRITGPRSRFTFVDIMIGELRFFADVKPLDGIESQAGLLFSAQLWNLIQKSCSKLIADTLDIPVDRHYVDIILDHIRKKIGLESVMTAHAVRPSQ